MNEIERLRDRVRELENRSEAHVQAVVAVSALRVRLSESEARVLEMESELQGDRVKELLVIWRGRADNAESEARALQETLAAERAAHAETRAKLSEIHELVARGTGCGGTVAATARCAIDGIMSLKEALKEAENDRDGFERAWSALALKDADGLYCTPTERKVLEAMASVSHEALEARESDSLYEPCKAELARRGEKACLECKLTWQGRCGRDSCKPR